jgi:hypothetical protein
MHSLTVANGLDRRLSHRFAAAAIANRRFISSKRFA